MPKRIVQAVKPSTHNESKASTAAIFYSERSPSLSTKNVTRKEYPDKRGKDGKIIADVTERVRGAFVCRGTRGIGKGRALFAARALKSGEKFSCRRTRIYLRRTENYEPSMWAVLAHPSQKTKVCLFV